MMGFFDKVKKALEPDKDNDETHEDRDIEDASFNEPSSRRHDVDEPYIFISYCDEDSPLVEADIKRFRKLGLNVWHDEDAYFNPQRSKEVMDAMSDSSLLVVFASQNYINSRLARDEIRFAIASDIPVVTVYLEKIELGNWFMLRLGDKLGIFKFAMDDASYIELCGETFADMLNVELADKPAPADDARGFRYFDGLIHSGAKEIVLDSDIVLGNGEQSEYGDGIRLDVDGIVIDGNGHKVDAKHEARIFECTGKDVTLKNITLQNGSAMIAGAILNDGEMTIVQSELSDNVAKYVAGAILNKGELTISESRVCSNISQKQTAGAIANDPQCRLTITKSELSSNRTRYGGGAIFNLGIAEISESGFYSNSNMHGMDHSALSVAFFETNADKNRYSGGAIVNEESGIMTISESLMDSNKGYVGGAIGNNGRLEMDSSKICRNAAYYAGAIFNNAKLEIGQSEFKDNETMVWIKNSVWWTSDGGAIVNDGILDISNTNFKANKSVCKGGAIANNKELMMSESCLMDNSAKRNGGAISNTMYLKADNCRILNNKSPKSIVDNSDYMQFYNTVFKANQSLNAISNEGDGSNLFIFTVKFMENVVEGSVLENNGDSCTIEKCIFRENLSNDNSKSIANNSNLTFIDSRIEEKGKTISNEGYILIKETSPDIERGIYGGGIVERTMIPVGEKFDFGHLDRKIHECEGNEIVLEEDITLERYELDFYEGGIELDIDGLTIDGNGKCIDGAGKSRIFLITADNVTLKNITFKNGKSYRNYDNISNSNGGALKSRHYVKLRIENCRFIDNESGKDGGAIYNPGMLDICKSSFTGNGAARDGGAIYNAGELNITKSPLRHNEAGHDGGAIHNGFKLTIEESVFSANSVRQYEIDMGKMTHSEFRRNVKMASEHFGGAIGSYGMLTVMNSQFDNNVANCGGAIGNKGKLTMRGSDLSNNDVWKWGSGGGIYNEGAELVIDGSVFKENPRNAIYLIKSRYESNNCTFKDNEHGDVYEEKE